MEHEEESGGDVIAPASIWGRLSAYRKHLGLSNPGQFEQIHKEIKNTFLTNFMFDGARADLTKVLSPGFQLSHAFQMGSTVQPSTYTLNSAYVEGKTFLQGSVDGDGALQGRFNYQLLPHFVSKFQFQLSGQPNRSMLQAELDYTGLDFTLNLKAINPSPVTPLTGIFLASYLQNITPQLSLGAEFVVQKPSPHLQESGFSYVVRYNGDNYVATAHLQSASALTTSYWHRVDERVEVGTELQTVLRGGRREAVCSVGAKWEFASATFRAMVDTQGRVQSHLEERLAPGFAVLFTGEMDHGKGQGRFGIGMMLES